MLFNEKMIYLTAFQKQTAKDLITGWKKTKS